MDISQVTNSKVCMVFDGFSGTNHIETLIFILDLKSFGIRSDDEVVIEMVPTVRFSWKESLSQPAVCVLGSKLYVFEGFNIGTPATLNSDPDGKAVFTYQLSEGVSNLRLEKSQLCKEAVEMNYTKEWPKAIATEDGKILVFSTILDRSSYNEFELYDPVTRKCHNLPDLPADQMPTNYEERLEILSFTFLKKNVFFLRTGFGVFTLDLKRSPRNWAWKRHGFFGDECLPSQRSLVVIEKKICLTPNRVFDIRERKRPSCRGVESVHVFALSYTFPALKSPCAAITLLDHQEKKDFSVCLLSVQRAVMVYETPKHPLELILHVYNTNLPTCMDLLSRYRREKAKEDPIWWKKGKESFMLPGTSKLLSLLSLRIKFTELFHNFTLTSFSSSASSLLAEKLSERA